MENIRFSPAQLLADKTGVAVTTKLKKKTGSKKTNGKYEVKYDSNGIKHLVLKSESY